MFVPPAEMCRNFWEGIRKRSARYHEYQMEREADAYKAGYDAAVRQFCVDAERLVNEQLADLIIRADGQLETAVKVIPFGYDKVTLKPVGSIKTIEFQPLMLNITLTPKNKYFNIVDVDVKGEVIDEA